MSDNRGFWGPSVWKTIHSMAAAYDPSNKSAYGMFVNSLPDLLPCQQCREHLKENLKKLPVELYLDNRHNLFFWSYVLHDTVNKSLGKTSPPYDQVKKEYFDAVGSECSKCKV